MKPQSAARRAERWPVIWGAICMVLLIAVVALVVAFVRASSVASCVNNVLGTRSLVGQQDPYLNGVLHHPPLAVVTDTDAQRAFITTVNDALDDPTQPNINKAKTTARHAKAVLAANDAYRRAHPLGQC